MIKGYLRIIIQFAQVHKYIFLLCFLGILPYVYYPQLNTPYTAIEFYSNQIYFTTWSNLFFGNFIFFLLPVGYFIYLLSHILPTAVATNLMYGLFVAVGGVGAYFVGKKFVKEELTSFIIGLFYMYGIYGQFASYWEGVNILVAVLPFITLCVLRISSKTNVLRTNIIFALLLFVLIGVNLTFLAYLAIWIGVIAVYKIQELGWRKSSPVILVLGIGGVLGLLLSSYYYISIFSQFHYQSSIVTTSLGLEKPEWKSSLSWLQELLREMGSVSYYYYFKGYAYPNALVFIYNPFIIFISFVFPFLAFLPSVLYRKLFKENKILIYFFLLFVLLFFMTMGVFYLSPTKDIYWWLYNNIPFFSIFRDAYKPMFLIHFMYAILIGYTLKYIYEYKRKYFRILAILTLLCIAIISFQFWSGTFLRQEIIRVPSYWNDFAKYVSDKRQNVTLTLPNMNFEGYDFSDIKGKNTGFFRSILDNNVIYEQGGTVYDDKLTRTLYASAISDPQCFAQLSGMLGISYLLNQYDLYVQLYDNSTTAAAEKKALEKMKDVKFEKQFGKLEFYSLNPKLVYDDIYIPKKVIPGEVQDFCSMAKESTGKNTIAVVNSKKIVQSPDTNTTVNFHSYNNAIYFVSIRNMQASPSQLLVLNKRFDGGWKLFEIQKDQPVTFFQKISLLTKQPLNASHIEVNGFANGWYVQKSTPDRDFLLVYMPQLYFYMGLMISGVAGIIALLLFIVSFRE